MNKARGGWRRLLGMLGGGRRERELADELASHIEMQTADNRRAGMDADEARRQARLKFGGVEAVKESYRDQRGLPWIENAFADFRYAVRTLRKSPAFALVVVATLALGIGANTAIFSLINQVLLNPRGISEPERVVTLQTRYDELNLRDIGISATTFADARASREIFQYAAIMRGGDINYTGGQTPVRLAGAAVSAEWFDVFGATPHLGRVFRAEEDQPNANRVVVLSYAAWQSLFGGDETVIGRRIELSQQQYEVIGVMRPEFRQPRQTEAWVPLGLPPSDFTERNRFNESYFAVARTQRGTSAEQADAWMGVLADRFRNSGTGPATYARDSKWDLYVIPITDLAAGDTKPALLILWAAVGLVLLIACANAAGLMLARTSAHAREIAVRAALGAGQVRLLMQTLSECLILGLSGGALGIGLAYLGIDVLLKLAPEGSAAGLDASLEGSVLLYTLAASILTALLFGAVPAWQISRMDPQQTLSSSAARSSTGGRQRLRSGLVVAETALALMLLVAAGIFLRSFARIQGVDPGFDPEGVMTAYFTLPPVQYEASETQASFYRAVLERLRNAPGIEAAGMGGPIPFSGETASASFEIEGREAGPGDPGPHGDVRYVTPGYFESLSIPLKRGRLFTEQDRFGTEPVAIIDENLARQYWPDEDPLGKRVWRGRGELHTIVGVVGHVMHSDLAVDSGKGTYYVSLFQHTRPLGVILAKTSSDPAPLAATVRDAVLGADPAQPVFNVRTLDSYVSTSLAPRRFVMRVLGFFAAAALFLAALGLYGVISYSVSQRTREIGIRMALGAEHASVLKLVMGHGLRLAAVGVLIGLAGAMLGGRFLESQLFEVSAIDPLTLGATAAVLVTAAALASYLPARRAVRVDPAVTLRVE